MKLRKSEVLDIITETLNDKCRKEGMDPTVLLKSIIEGFVQMAKEAEQERCAS